jgi:mono/diheme cytochrome c family protein
LGILAVLLVVGLTPAQNAPPPVYQKNCVRCHLDNGEGGGYAHTLSLPLPANLTLVRDTPEMVASILSGGIPGTAMPSFPQLNDNELAELYQTIVSFPEFTDREYFYPWRQPRYSDQPAEVARVFATQCSGCHGPGGAGDGWWSDDDPHVWPKPANFHARNSEQGRLFHIILDGRWGTMMPPNKQRIPESTIWSLARYVYDLQQPQAPVAGMSDGDWFTMISKGVPNTPMPAWQEWLPLRQRWDLVRYIKEGLVLGRPYVTSVFSPNDLPPHMRQVDWRMWTLQGNRLDPAHGKAIFATYCAPCHVNNGQSRGPSPALVGSGSPAPYPPSLPFDYIFWRANEGVAGTIMPQFQALLPERDLWDVSYYTYGLSQSGLTAAAKAPGAKAAAPARPGGAS